MIDLLAYKEPNPLALQRVRLVDLLKKRAERRARPWGEPVPFARIEAAPFLECGCCGDEDGRRRLYEQKGATTGDDLGRLINQLPSVEDELLREKERKTKEGRQRAFELAVLAVFEAYGNGLSSSLIVDVLGEEVEGVDQALRRLEARGLVDYRGGREGWFRRSIVP